MVGHNLLLLIEIGINVSENLGEAAALPALPFITPLSSTSCSTTFVRSYVCTIIITKARCQPQPRPLLKLGGGAAATATAAVAW